MTEDKGEDATEYMNLKILGHDNSVTPFKIKKHALLIKCLKTYFKIIGLDRVSVIFSFDGHRIIKTDTPSSLEMKEGDVIEVFLRQIGG
ncbi:unnamed protein product [Aphis gossypii]|uniref:Rad60/SUMO-like domain-containing protein n=1 Tax=Aphis gossypii TaxID=80765 RepID=A0A9P0J2D5_APHGO|nr:unnamed protein product [Aphis gossypii]CAH1725661.1 unnamed protein product [Aphis gossypii]